MAIKHHAFEQGFGAGDGLVNKLAQSIFRRCCPAVAGSPVPEPENTKQDSVYSKTRQSKVPQIKVLSMKFTHMILITWPLHDFTISTWNFISSCL
jgi:hypothetical protein